MRLAKRCRKGWPDLDVGTSLRGADGCRPVFSVVATPFRSIFGAQVGTSGAADRAGSARRRRDIDACRRGCEAHSPDPALMTPGVSAPFVVDSWCAGNHIDTIPNSQIGFAIS